MKKRRISRETALQFLYQYDTKLTPQDKTNLDFKNEFELFISTTEDNISQEIMDFAVLLSSGTCQHIEAIDSLIENYSENWKISRISKIDRNILRIAIYEMVYLRTIPPPVTINEAIEIAKRFGAEDSSSFINGMLDKIKTASEKGELNYD